MKNRITFPLGLAVPANLNVFVRIARSILALSALLTVGSLQASHSESPTDLSLGVPSGASQQLSWIAGTGALSYDVYFSTSAADVTNGETVALKGNQVGTRFDTPSLQAGEAYYWRVDDVTSEGTNIGDVWSFRTDNHARYDLSEGQLDVYFADPPNEYRLVNYQLGNTSDLAEGPAHGYGGYMGFWKDTVHGDRPHEIELLVEAAKDQGRMVWGADDDGYPSGSAGGLVVQNNPEYEVRGVAMLSTSGTGQVPVSITTPGDCEKMVSAVLYPVSSGVADYSQGQVQSVAETGVTTTSLTGDWKLCAFVLQIRDTNTQAQTTTSNFGTTGHYPDMLNPDAIASWMSLVHEPVLAEMSDPTSQFEGFYANEPNLMQLNWDSTAPYACLSWNDNLFSTFQTMHGYDLEASMGALYDQDDLYSKRVRMHYHQTVAEMLRSSFTGQIAEWCAERGLVASGHPLIEESLHIQVANFGDMLKVFSEWQVPAMDLPMPEPSQVGAHNSHMPKLFSSIGSWKEYDHRVAGLLDPVVGGFNRSGVPTKESLRITANAAFRSGVNLLTSYIDAGHSQYGSLPVYADYNDYVGRISTMLTGARVDSAVALYYPIDMFQMEYKPVTGTHWSRWDPSRQVAWDNLQTDMLDQGIDYNIVHSDWLLDATVDGGKLKIGSGAYSYLVMPDVEVIAANVLTKIQAFEAAGGTVLWVTDKPFAGAYASEDAAVVSAVAGYSTVSASQVPGLITAPYDTSRFTMAITSSDSFQVARFNRDGRALYFLENPSASSITVDLSDSGLAKVYDPETGTITTELLPANVSVGAYGAVLVSPVSTTNLAPFFNTSPVVESRAIEDVAYSASLAGDAEDAEGDALAFAKVSGPAWLNVASNGVLSGTPMSDDVGLNDFIVSVTDGNSAAVEAGLEIEVASVLAPRVYALQYGSFEYLPGIWNWEPIQPSWNPSNASNVYQARLLTTAQFDQAAEGYWAANLKNCGSISQDLGAVSAGEYAKVSFDVGKTISGTAGALQCIFLVDDVVVDTLQVDTTSQSANSWQRYTHSVDIDATGILTLKFTWVSGEPWLDTVESVEVGPAVTAAFSVSALSGDLPFEVTFTDLSNTGSVVVANREWDFGDGTTLTTSATSVTHTYYVAGSYTAQLFIGGSSSIYQATEVITVTEPAGVDLLQIQDGSFEQPGSGWSACMASWNDTGTNIYELRSDPGHMSQSADGVWSGLMNKLGTISQNLGVTIDAGDTLEVSFYAGRSPVSTSSSGGGEIECAFIIDGTRYPMSVDTTALAEDTWQLYTHTKTVSNTGNLVLEFKNVNGKTWIDDIGYIQVTKASLPPSFTANPVVEVDATEDLAYAGSLADDVSDPNDDVLTFAKISGPTWLSVASDGSLSGTPTNADVGLNTFTVSAFDGVEPVTETTLEITVGNVNDAPVFTSISLEAIAARADASYSSSLAEYALDDDGDGLTFAMVSGPAWLSVASDGSLSGTPVSGDVGMNSFTVSVTDGSAPEVEVTLELYINNALGPQLYRVLDGSFEQDGSGWSTVMSSWNTTNTGSSAIYALRSGSGHMTTPAHGNWSGYMKNLDAISQNLGVTVNAGDTLEISFYGGQALGSSSSSGGGVIECTFIVGDTRYLMEADTTSLDEDTWALYNHQVTVTNSGNLVLEFMSESGKAWIDDISYVMITEPNVVPAFSSGPVVEVNATEGLAYSSSLADDASDPNGDPLIFAKVAGPAWLTIASDGSLSGTPTAADVGLNAFTVSVSDGIAAAVEATLEIAVDLSPPQAVTNPYPTNAESLVLVDAQLDWAAVSTASSYDVYFGTSTLDYQGNQVGTTFDPGTLQRGLTYYWRVDAVNSGGTTTGEVWSFATEAPWNATVAVADGSFEQTGSGWSACMSSWNDTGTNGYELRSSPAHMSSSAEGVWSGLMSNLGTISQNLSTTVEAGDYLSITFSGGRSKDSVNTAGGGKIECTFIVGSTPYSMTVDTALLAPDSWQDYTHTVLVSNSGNLSIEFASGDGKAWIDNISDVSIWNGYSGSTPPDAPTALTAEAGTDEISLDWSDNTEIDFAHYSVYRSTTSGSGYVALATNLSASDYVDATATNHTTYYYVVSATDTDGNESLLSADVSAELGFGYAVAGSEYTVQGMVSGGVAETSEYDDLVQTLTEVVSVNTSVLEHKWVFDVASAELVTFYVDAYHTANSESDDFVFAYSTNDVDYTDMVTVTKTANDDTEQAFYLPSGLSGSVYVRVMDTDRTSSHTQLDSLYVDGLFIVSEESEFAPVAASAPVPADGAINVSVDMLLEWSASPTASSYDVYFGTSTLDFQGNQTGTGFDPGALEYGTTYYWSVDAINNSGTTEGAQWSFVTEPLMLSVVDGSFENPTGTDLWRACHASWNSTGTGIYELLDFEGVHFDAASEGDWSAYVGNIGTISQDLETVVSVGDTLTITFLGGHSKSSSNTAGGGEIRCSFIVGGTSYSMTADTALQDAHSWQSYTHSVTITNGGNLSIEFSNTGGSAWLDDIGAVSVIRGE